MPVRTAILGPTELTVSRVGFGCYRIHEFEPDHREALRFALLNGVNLIDTSTNYTDGSSERLIGEITSELIAAGSLQRSEFVIVTKIGYVQGTNLTEARERAQAGHSFPEMVEFQETCWHNISPDFLEHQISRSLERLRLDTIDVVLLHNPEYFLKAGGTRDQYYKRIEKAFRHLEAECDRGRIRSYGVSSNTFPEPESRSDFSSLARMVEIAKKVSTTPRFSVIQMPFNLYEAGAALNPNNMRLSAIDFATKENIAVLTNRPFNSFAKDRLVRLTSFPTHDEVTLKGDLHTTLSRAIDLEKNAPSIQGRIPIGFQWAHVLREKLPDLDDLLTWREALYQQILPSIRQALQRIEEKDKKWADDYRITIQELLKFASWDMENLAEKKSQLITTQIESEAKELALSPTLSRQMLRTYFAFPQITSVLVGMRTRSYIEDVLGAEAPLSQQDARAVLMKMEFHRR